MELSSSESIRALLAALAAPTPVQQRSGATDVARSTRTNRRLRCRCGHCRECLENARWERIFTEKFADPTYYTSGPLIRTASPLTSI